MTTPIHPGSRTHAAAYAAEAEQPNQFHVSQKADELESQIPTMQPVPVHELVPEGAVYSTMSLSAGAVRQLMPQDIQRMRAVVTAVDEPIVLCQTKEQAQNAANQASNVPYPTGFYLAASASLELKNKALVWVANTSTTTATRISLVVERYENPDPLR